MALKISPKNGDVPVVKDEYLDHLVEAPKDHLTPQKMVQPPIVGVTAVQKKGSPEVHQTEEKMYSPAIPVDKLHNLNVGGKRTINLGNYESATIMVSLTVPCTKETLDDAYEFASGWVSGQIEKTINAAKKGI